MLNKYGLTTILLKKRSQPQDWRLCSFRRWWASQAEAVNGLPLWKPWAL